MSTMQWLKINSYLWRTAQHWPDHPKCHTMGGPLDHPWFLLILHTVHIKLSYPDHDMIYRIISVIGLRQVLERFFVPMHEGACETGSQIPRVLARGIWHTVRTSLSALGTTNPDRSVLITIITQHFQFHTVNVSNLHVKGAYMLEARAVSLAPPIVTSRGAP